MDPARDPVIAIGEHSDENNFKCLPFGAEFGFNHVFPKST
jgi:hypothetical protein